VSAPPSPAPHRLIGTLRASLDGFVDDDVLTLAAALSFYTLLSVAPVIGLAIWLVSILGPGARDSLLDELALLGGDAARSAASAVIESGKAHPDFGGFAGIAGVVLLVVGATTVFAQLQSSLNVIFKVAAAPSNAIRSWIRRRVLSAGVLLAAFFVLIVSLVVSAALGWLLPRSGLVWDAANQIITAIVLAMLFGVLFRYLPDARIPWRHALSGGLVTAILFAIGKWLIAIYVQRADVGGAYGAAGSLVVLLVWAYYSAAIFFVGAELTKGWLVQSGEPIRAAANGTAAAGDDRSANPNDL
jgi:membrane protein